MLVVDDEFRAEFRGAGFESLQDGCVGFGCGVEVGVASDDGRRRPRLNVEVVPYLEHEPVTVAVMIARWKAVLCLAILCASCA